jgi:hypothetical protein
MKSRAKGASKRGKSNPSHPQGWWERVGQAQHRRETALATDQIF